MSLIDDIKLLAERGKTPGIRACLSEAAEQLAARDRTPPAGRGGGDS